VSVKRRTFLEAALAAASVAGLGGAGCRRTATREELLYGIVLDVVVPSAREVLETSEALVRATEALAAAPNVDALRAARRAFRPALLAWKGAQCFRHGPFVETSALLRALFWPSRPDTIEKALGSARAPDDALVSDLGVDAKGLYALEYLLFPLELDEAGAATRFSGDDGARRRSFAAALARSVHSYAAASSRRLGNGKAYAESFARAGGESLSALLAEVIGAVEIVAAHRLEYVLKLAESRLLKPREVEGWASGLSREIALRQLTSTERLYQGASDGGLSALTRAVAPAVDQRVRTLYAQAISQVRALEAPLEQVVRSNRGALARAAEVTKRLEITMKVELTSALGITLTFASTDGD
jgi:predicted lipoprotein